MSHAALPRSAPLARRVALGLVVVLHLAVLLLWQAPQKRFAGLAGVRSTITVALLPEVIQVPPAAPVPVVEPPATRAPSRPAQPRASRPRRPPAAPSNPSPLAEPPPSGIHLPAAAAPESNDDAASAAIANGDAPLLGTAASRRAISDAARRPSLAAQAGIDNREHTMQTPNARLGTEIAKGAVGDCAKGEYAGGGMGLLSLPFLAAAVLTEKCRR